MSNTTTRIGLLALGLLLLSGCGSLGDFNGQHSSQAVMTSNNYQVVETGVRGADAGFKVFGIGGHAQYATALDKIRILAEMDKRPRALINVTKDYNWFNLGIVSGDSVVVTADVIEFTGPPNGN
jgi:hypothetical protein